MSIWPFKQIILNAQLKKGPISPLPQSTPSQPQPERPEAGNDPAPTATVQDLVREKQSSTSHQQVSDQTATAAIEEQRQDNTAAGQMQTAYLFHFGDTTAIRKALSMPNRLTG